MYCIWRSRTVMWNYLGSVFFLGYFLLRTNCQNATDVSTSQTGNKHCRIAQASNSNSPPPRYNLFVTLLNLSSGVNQIFYRNIYHCVMVCDWHADQQDYFFSIVYRKHFYKVHPYIYNAGCIYMKRTLTFAICRFMFWRFDSVIFVT